MSENSLSLDKFDLRILDTIQHDADKTTAEIAEIVGLSQSPCWKRINRMEKLGIIQKRVAILDRKKLGLNVIAFVNVTLSEPGRQQRGQFENAVHSIDEVLECHTMLGEKDFLLKVCVLDIDHLEELLKDRLWSIPGIQTIRTDVVLSENKSKTAYAIG